ncbi:hypothetical protein ACFLRY_02585 [Bacteroidota bacterium]
MTKENIHKDEFLAGIIADAELQKPATNFTDRVMSQIEFSSQRISQSDSEKAFINNPTWIALGIAAVSLIVCLIFVDFSFLTQFFTEINFGNINIVSLFSNIKTSFISFFDEIQIPPIAAIAIVAIAALFIIDRFVLRIKAIHIFTF